MHYMLPQVETQLVPTLDLPSLRPNIASEAWLLEDDPFLLGNGLFSGASFTDGKWFSWKVASYASQNT